MGAAVAEWLSSWLAKQEDRGSIPGLASWIGYLLLLAIHVDVNVVATLFVVITTFCPVTRIELKQITFVVKGQNVEITTTRVATALTSKDKM